MKYIGKPTGLHQVHPKLQFRETNFPGHYWLPHYRMQLKNQVNILR